MAVTQYIGARYVPKFFENSDGTEEWRSGVEYEPLTIVTYNGNSYTSKKPVPSTAGNPSSDSEYWASTGTYNAQVEIYRQQVEAYKTEVDTLSDDLDEMFDRNTNKRVILISDSYGNAFDGNPSWLQLCEAQIPYTSESYYLGGAGFGYAAGGQYDNLRFDRFAETFMPNVENPEEVTDIVLAAGANDANQTYDGNYGNSEIIAGFTSFVNYVRGFCPNARISIGFCGRIFNMTMLWAYLQARNCYRSMAEQNKYCTWIPNLEYALHKESLLRSDHLHPSAEGMQNIAEMVACYIKDGVPGAYIDGGAATITPLANNGITPTISGAEIRSYTENNITKVFSKPSESGSGAAPLGIIDIHFPGSGQYGTFGGFANTAICILDECCSMGENVIEWFPASVMLATLNNGNIFTSGRIGIRNKTVYLQVDTESAYNDVNFVYIYAFNMTYDSMHC